jgi:hypothetical protein
MPRLLLLARTAAFFLLAVLGARAVLNTHVVWLGTNAANHVSPGTVTVSLAGRGAPADGVAFDVPRLAPGDTAATAVDLVGRRPLARTDRQPRLGRWEPPAASSNRASSLKWGEFRSDSSCKGIHETANPG